jgi:hypothetical protein
VQSIRADRAVCADHLGVNVVTTYFSHIGRQIQALITRPEK